MTFRYSSAIEALSEIFGYKAFRHGQEEMIDALISGRDVIGILPTGGGKSVCYQVPSLVLPGLVVVISPLIALMKDQVEFAMRRGIFAAFINSSMKIEQLAKTYNDIVNSRCNLLYVSPERLLDTDFMMLLKRVEISFFAIDEAHCISSWGHDFRLAYRKISIGIDELGLANGRRIPRMALTATANPNVYRDIIEHLGLQSPFSFVGGFDRANIFFEVIESADKSQDILTRVKQSPGSPSIVYCSTIKNAEFLYASLIRSGIKAGIYHGKLNAVDKNLAQDQFLADQIDVMVATNAFGMGVDKQNVRHVIHYSMPGSMEAFYQEAGRAGRDGKPAKSTIYYHKNDENIHKFFVDSMCPDENSIRAVLYVLVAFETGMPLSYTFEDIARYSSIALNPRQVDSILKILSDQGLISVKNFEGNSVSRVIEVVNSELLLDTSYIQERKRILLENIMRIRGYCTTQICRRSVLIGYFENKPKYEFCGNCDVCLKRQKLKDETAKIYPEEVILSVLNLICSSDNKYSVSVVVEILLGLNKAYFKSLGISSLNEFGSLSLWMIQDVNRLLVALIREKFLIVDEIKTGFVSITDLGKRSLVSHDLVVKIQSADFVGVNGGIQNNIKTKCNQTLKISREKAYNNLVELRRSLSEIKQCPAFMIYSDDTIERLINLRPSVLGDLSHAGLSERRIDQFGPFILSALAEVNEDVTDKLLF